ncbi:MAG: 50S ribosomal protein L13 [Planctomycetota bacterium]|nr:50S ribosomal protein L13 [Planctomycetota bacterium]
MKTTMVNSDNVTREWFEVDASNKIMGRLAADIARILMGKHKPIYTPHVDCGDYVIVTNVEKLAFTGNKLENRSYHFYSGYPGGTYRMSLGERMKKHPERVFKNAVRLMLPKNRLGKKMLTKLKVVTGPEHRHSAQKPKPLEL